MTITFEHPDNFEKVLMAYGDARAVLAELPRESPEVPAQIAHVGALASLLITAYRQQFQKAHRYQGPYDW